MEGFPFASLITPQTGVGGLVLAVLAAVVWAGLRRWDRGSVEAMAGLSGLNDRLVKAAERAELAKEDAEADADVVRGQLIRVQEYARSLEERLGIPHRTWDDA